MRILVRLGILRIAAIHKPDYHPREETGPEEMKKLVTSISSFGFLYPIIVRPIGKGQYEVLSGSRRLQAMRELGRKTIPAMILYRCCDRDAELICFGEFASNIKNPTDAERGLQEWLGDSIAGAFSMNFKWVGCAQ